MRDRKKRNIIIGSLCCLLVFMGVGYAVLSQTLNINGTATLTGEWEIFIDSITVSEIAGSAKSNVAEVSDDKMGASFDVELLKPGDYVEYEVVVKNDGTINAVLRELVPSIETNNMDILLTHSIIQGQILKAKSETKFTLKIRFDERATEIVTGGATSFDIKMIYEQYDGDATQIDPELVPVTANNCFDIDSRGTITGYDYSCGTYVTVPAVVNDIAVKEISRHAFSYNYNSSLYFENRGDDFPKIIVAQDSETYTMLMGLLERLGGSEATGVSVLMKGDKLPDTAVDLYRQNGNIDATMNVTYTNPNIEYLDLSQASALTKIESSAFASDSNTKTLKYLNLEGVSAEALSGNFVFENADLEYLTVDSDLFNSFMFAKMAADTLRILKGENSNEIVGITGASSLAINNLIIGEGITKASGFTNRGITTLELPSTLVEIGDKAFQQNNLTTLKLPASVKTIGDYAFDNNNISDDGNPNSSGSQYWFENVETIGDYAFRNNSLVDVRFSSGTKEIGNFAFYNNPTMENVMFNQGVGTNVLVSIGNNAFQGNGITSASLIDLKDIGDYAFEGNNFVGSSSWGSANTIETIGTYAFANNPNLADGMFRFSLGENIKSIGNNAFDHNGSKLLNLNVPCGVTVTYNGQLPAANSSEAVEVNLVKYYYWNICN